MKQAILVFIGGGAGSLLRYAFSFLNPYFDKFFIGTFAANLFACVLLGLTAGLAGRFGQNDYLKYLLATGLCGGFSTFSTFSSETYSLIGSERYVWAFAYVALSVLFSFGGLLAGSHLSKTF